MSEPVLNPGEAIIKQANYRRGRHGALLVLTNQRLILHRLLGDEPYPLAHVAGAVEYQPEPSPFVFAQPKQLRVDFDNGGALVLLVGDLPGWVEAINQAKTGAPMMPYAAAPTAYAPPFSPQSPTLHWVLIAAVIVAIFFMVCLVAVAALWLALSFGSH